ncbi:OLC1v1013866C1 [Oldenlandia corymbosa var. corymbosa]|uniref:OLC1v1013866C1 n=1 Tax=Oldenlandia corymbosa var. corymbosa TaxID=529605 RepID=A0AAV1E2Y5_OLDCO|nr:OLC1v1013866C1 [Oldenlandia corymbosa var. corymbosa]
MAESSMVIDSVEENLGGPETQMGVPEVLQLELRFLLRLMQLQKSCKEAGQDANFRGAGDWIFVMLKKAGLSEAMILDHAKVRGFLPFAPILLNKYEQFEPKIKAMCAVSLDSLLSMPFSSDEFLRFFDCLVESFMDLVNLKAYTAGFTKNQIMVNRGKLSFLRTLLDFSAKRCIDPQILQQFLSYVRVVVHDAAFSFLSLLLKGKEAAMAQGLEAISNNLLQRLMPCTLGTVKMFVSLLKASKSSRFYKFQVLQVVVSLTDFILEAAVVDPLKDQVGILREGLIFMLTFVMSPPEEAVNGAGEALILVIDHVIDEVLSRVLSLDMTRSKEDISSLHEKIHDVKEKVRILYAPVLSSSGFSSPMTGGMQWIDFFLENLKEMVKRNPDKLASVEHQIVIILDELLVLKPFLKGIIELLKEREDLKNLWKQINNLLFLAEHVISSCLIVEHPIWYDMLQLSNVKNAIKLIEIVVKKYDCQMSETISSHIPTRQVNTSNFENAVVGCKDEIATMIGKLRTGTTQLDIVSVVGMPGLGKSTIAEKVYNDPCIKYYFHIRAWCCVPQVHDLSQVYDLRDLYFDILYDVTGRDAREFEYSDDGFRAELKKRLKGRKYLIVLDDMWNIETWDGLKDSFPDDNNGSRIIIISRIPDLLPKMKEVNCSPILLWPLSDEESWELLKWKLAWTHNSPPNDELSIIGPFVHSLILVGDDETAYELQCPPAFFDHFKHLNVLDLERINVTGSFPKEVTLMVHLRYLAIFCSKAGEIPSSIVNLWNLETIIVKCWTWIQLPRAFLQMKSLRHVHITKLVCGNLEDHEYGQLNHLESLSTLIIDSRGAAKELLKRLSGIRKLKYEYDYREFCMSPCKSPELSQDCPKFLNGIANLKFPELSHVTHLESLAVENIDYCATKWDQIPSFGIPNSLKKMTLIGLMLPWNVTAIIGQLPKLEVLKLRGQAFSGKKWEGRRWDVKDGEFLSLKYLQLRDLDVKEWTVQDEPFLSLERLIVSNLHHLVEIPSGLGYIKTLKMIKMDSCSDTSRRSARGILKEQQEIGNDVLEVFVDDAIDEEEFERRMLKHGKSKLLDM